MPKTENALSSKKNDGSGVPQELSELKQRLKEIAFAFVPLSEIKDYFDTCELEALERNGGIVELYKKEYRKARLNYRNLLMRSAIEGKSFAIKSVHRDLTKCNFELGRLGVKNV